MRQHTRTYATLVFSYNATLSLKTSQDFRDGFEHSAYGSDHPASWSSAPFHLRRWLRLSLAYVQQGVLRRREDLWPLWLDIRSARFALHRLDLCVRGLLFESSRMPMPRSSDPRPAPACCKPLRLYPRKLHRVGVLNTEMSRIEAKQVGGQQAIAITQLYRIPEAEGRCTHLRDLVPTSSSSIVRLNFRNKYSLEACWKQSAQQADEYIPVRLHVRPRSARVLHLMCRGEMRCKGVMSYLPENPKQNDFCSPRRRGGRRNAKCE
ncbi:hypothetical protein PLICRDRAFT_649941 [Plicaturopsis crispa FD-325 SS-3]|nr:hypothetical protein PLICRDRAFT_649941 [Plicaturopsis crispa FD-325 SS-3]